MIKQNTLIGLIAAFIVSYPELDIYQYLLAYCAAFTGITYADAFADYFIWKIRR